MFKNVGKKVMMLAKVVFWLVTLLSGVGIGCVAGLIFDDDFILCYILLAIPVGAIFGWISAIFVYAFGELVDRVTSIDKKLQSKDLKEFTEQKVKKAFVCPKCGVSVLEGDPACTACGQKFDWEKNS